MGNADVLVVVAEQVAVLGALGALSDSADYVLAAARAHWLIDVQLLGFVIAGMATAVLVLAEVVMREGLRRGNQRAGASVVIASPFLLGVKNPFEVIEADHLAALIVQRDIDGIFAHAGKRCGRSIPGGNADAGCQHEQRR